MENVSVLAYTAGLLDGEGMISVTHAVRKHRSPVQVFILGIGMTHEPTVRWLQGQWGGNVVALKTKQLRKDGSPRRTLYRWYVCSGTALPILQAVFPYLITKKEQAGFAIEWLKMAHGRGYRYSYEEHCKRAELFKRISALTLCSGYKRPYEIPVNSVEPGTKKYRRKDKCGDCGAPAVQSRQCAPCFSRRMSLFGTSGVGNTEPSGRMN